MYSACFCCGCGDDDLTKKWVGQSSFSQCTVMEMRVFVAANAAGSLDDNPHARALSLTCCGAGVHVNRYQIWWTLTFKMRHLVATNLIIFFRINHWPNLVQFKQYRQTRVAWHYNFKSKLDYNQNFGVNLSLSLFLFFSFFLFFLPFSFSFPFLWFFSSLPFSLPFLFPFLVLKVRPLECS